MRIQEKTESPLRAAQRLQQEDPSATNEETRIADTMNRLASPDFPPELLLQVVETAVKLQVGHWKVTYSHKLDALAASLFAWPDGVTDATRRLLRQTAETALLKRCIIRIPADLDVCLPLRYQIPSALLKSESNVKHLAIDLDNHAGSSYSRELSAATDHMAMLAEAFPRLTTCTFLLRIEYDSLAVWPRSTASVEATILGLSGWRVQDTITRCTMEDHLVDFIAAFVRSGPGRRKRIRFNKQKISILSSDEPNYPNEFRPMVKVKRPDVEDSLANAEKHATINAKRILNEAFRGPWETRGEPHLDV